MMKMKKMEKIQRICVKRGIAYPTAEIYGGVSGFYDFGPVGTLLKNKLIDYWRDFFVRSEENVFEIDGSTVLPNNVFIASGHVKSFVDPLTQCKSCNSMFRADHLIEDISGQFVEGLPAEELTGEIRKRDIRCPRCGGELNDVKVFNMMFKTFLGPLGNEEAYLRPETAQNIFVGFKRLFKSMRTRLPLGVAQYGLSFRNEISPRHFLVRLREFSQVEIEMFFDPKYHQPPKFKEVENQEIIVFTKEAQKGGKLPVKIKVKRAVADGIIPNEWMGYYLAKEFGFYKSLGIPEKSLRFRHMLPEETPHYSRGNFDLEIEFEFGWKETVGNAYRMDYDLKNHMEKSGIDLSVTTEDKRKIIPYVVEPSFGIERTLNGILFHCFREGKERGWSWFQFPPRISPYVAAVFPLLRRNALPKKAREVFDKLKEKFDVFYDEVGSIGKRYARADEIGTLVCITVDHRTLKEDSVTLRNRDDTKQTRIEIKELPTILRKLGRGEIRFDELLP